MTPPKSEPEKKRHHYVPVTYLEGFTNANGMITAYLKDDPTRPFEQKPENIAFHKFYYSQPLPDGGQDNNTLENFFSTVEGKWPSFVRALQEGTLLSREQVTEFIEFLTLMRVRVPAARDMIELTSADILLNHMHRMDERGELPPRPAGLELSDIQMTIDPHMSLHAMPKIIEGFVKIWDDLAFEIIHNRSGIPFITSDNPVIYFDPSVPEGAMLPYTVRPPMLPVELFFPINTNICIRGITADRIARNPYSFRAYDTRDGQQVKRINRLVAKFGYRFVFADSDHVGPLVRKYADQSPTLEHRKIKTDTGELMINQIVFGKRREKPKWERASVRLEAKASAQGADDRNDLASDMRDGDRAIVRSGQREV